MAGVKTKEPVMNTVRIAFSIAYCSNTHTNYSICEAEEAGSRLRMVVNKVLKEKFDSSSQVIGSTQSTVANQRHSALSQEPGIASAGDVVIMSFRIPAEDNTKKFLEDLYLRIQDNLQDDTRNILHVRLLAFRQISLKSLFHAESDCTQRIYHYLLPLSWLPDGDKLQRWWLNTSLDGMDGFTNNTTAPHLKFKKSPPPSDSLRKLRDALESAKSKTIPNRRDRRKGLQRASGGSTNRTTDFSFLAFNNKNYTINDRSGVFANKERRPWHNFADPNLRGDASPNQEPVWRVVDAAQIAGFLTTKYGEVMAILEFRGDDFVQGQIRSIVGSALAITHGWLPPDMFDIATKTDSFLETPMAPPGRLYLANVRFHFQERKIYEGMLFGGTEGCTNATGARERFENEMKWVQEQLMDGRRAAVEVAREKKWLEDLQHKTAPRIQNQILSLKSPLVVNSVKTTYVPKLYNHTLQLLRNILASGQWPKTSLARSSVIRNVNIGDSDYKINAGSFTVSNPEMLGTITSGNFQQLPFGSLKFPELTNAVFALERALSSHTVKRQANLDGSLMETNNNRFRPPSLCCAINCNAQFTPHVDSGRGAGQSLSMIVGMGDYGGGEVVVEGIPHDIQYDPLEFDGWSSRHWTNNYEGERFSLVWFTPELTAKR
eukprot:CAMPEP_0194263428 /NCGR_PEP_ID=MMETSP0158-20130606/47052_1 /TAXON_ID=33649 /ORGANISM="Thalassionema nitzschioides, Strain L26-B" /LENGTH=659 /DNA_ID=CAMNT_0039003611 /DNA_START=346 /DNA_END=2325 /DNA_ORIENTATION=-